LILMGDWCGSGKKIRNLASEIADAVKALKSLANMVQERTFYPRKKTVFFLNGILFSLDEGLLMGDPGPVCLLIDHRAPHHHT